MSDRERDIAIREAHENDASCSYFGARIDIDTRSNRRLFADGFARGWNRGAPTHPAGLTDEQIEKVADGMPGGQDGFGTQWGWLQFARAIEAAHGIPISHKDE